MNKSRLIFAILIALGCALAPAVVFADGPGELEQALKQRNLPTVSATAPTDGQVMTWDSTLGKAKWAAGGGGGGSFNPAAATAITFTTGLGAIEQITGPSDQDTTIKSGAGRALYLQGTSSEVALIGAAGSGAGSGADASMFAGQGGATGAGGSNTIRSGAGGATSGASGNIAILAGGTTDGNTGSISLTVPTPNGANRSSGEVLIQLGNKTGSGTANGLVVRNAASSDLFKVAYNGTVTVTDTITHSTEGGTLYLQGKDSVTASTGGAQVRITGGMATDAETGGTVELRGGYASDSSDGAYVTVGGAQLDGNGASVTLTARSGLGAGNNNGGTITAILGNKTNSGTAGSLSVQNAALDTLFKIAYDGTVTGPTGAAFNITAATSQNLNLTAPNQILFNSAGDYMRMGNAFLNLSSAGGLYFCSETTASTTDMKIYRGGTRVIKVASSLTGDDTDRPMYFSTRSCEGANLTSGIDIYSANGTTSLTSLWGGAYGGASTLQLVAGGTTVTIDSNGLTSSAARFTVGTSGPTITRGSGSPESSVTAGPGSIYLRTGGGAGTSFYVKESGTGNTGWVAK